jgi:tetratricopeptide (TPR) repeat protein/outer membrane protein assembly factor BamB
MFWAVVMIWAAHVHAQDADVPAGPDRRAADSVEAGVYLDDSLEAADQLTRALRLAETEQWPEAVTVMQQVTANFARNLVQLEPGLYVNVAEYVNRQIAGWPEAGLEAYRARAQAGAKSAVDSALAAQPGDQSIEQLIDVVERYYCTTHAVRAADAAAQLSMEAGRFALASDLYARLLRRHPDREQWAMPIKAKLALSQAWAGRAEQARQLVAEITKANPEFKVTWRSTELPIAEAIEHELAALADTMLETQADEADFVWPTYGGGAGRNRPIASQAQAGAPLWRIEGVGGLTDGIGSGAGAHEMEQGRYLALQPTTAGGIIYLHNDDTVHAVWASNGEPAWAPFRARGLSGTSRRFSRGQQPPPLYTTTLGGRRLYIRLGGGPLSSRSRSRDRESILVCLDARTGRRIWRVDRQRLGPWFEKTYFDSSPTYHDGKLYVIARNRRSLGFEDCYLLCFSAETGEVEWKTHLASGATGGFGQLRPTLGYLAIAGHAAYVCTHLGAIVSVSLHNGQVRWARIYADAPNDGTRLFDAPYRQRNGPWQYDPVMVWRDRIVCKPLDTDRLLTLDQADGAIVADTKLDRLHDLEYIAGILDDRLYGVGEQVFCWNLLDNQEVWARDLPPDGAIYGRGCLTTTHLFVPTQGGLHRYPVDETDADGRAWDGKKEGGNILVTPTQILVAGNDHLSAYARKDQALARLRDRITEAPDNPAGYLDLSELAFRVAEYDDGIAALESAADRAGGFTQITEAAIKRRVFRNCLHFADVLLTLEPPRRDDALTLYGRAGQCAPDTAGHVAFRRRIAAFHAIAGDYARAIEYWQQILTDRSLRQVGVSIDEGKEITAGELAESTIDRLMRTHGREVYAPFEDRARALLAAGRTTGQTHLLARVSDVFPNSRSAAPALIAQGDLLGRDDRFLDAARLYRRALTRYRDQIDAPALMRRLSDRRLAGQGGARVSPSPRHRRHDPTHLGPISTAGARGHALCRAAASGGHVTDPCPHPAHVRQPGRDHRAGSRRPDDHPLGLSRRLRRAATPPARPDRRVDALRADRLSDETRAAGHHRRSSRLRHGFSDLRREPRVGRSDLATRRVSHQPGRLSSRSGRRETKVVRHRPAPARSRHRGPESGCGRVLCPGHRRTVLVPATQAPADGHRTGRRLGGVDRLPGRRRQDPSILRPRRRVGQAAANPRTRRGRAERVVRPVPRRHARDRDRPVVAGV